MEKQPADRPSSPAAFASARAALRDGRIDEAVALAEDALRAAVGPGETAGALAVIGEAALRRDRPREALPHLDESFRLAPRAYTAGLIVKALYRTGSWEDGIARLRSFLRSFPGDPYLRRQEALYHLEKGGVPRAIEVLEGILRDDPGFALARDLLVEARTRSAAPEEKVRMLEDLFRVESKRNDPALRYRQGRNRLEAGDLAGACREFEAAAALEPGNAFYRRHLAFALKKAGNLAEAIRLLRELFIADPSDRFVRSALQGACKDAGNRETFREAVREALRLHPEAKPLLGILRKAEREA